MIILSRERPQRRKTWIEAEILRQANLTIIRNPQFYLPNSYDVEEECESVEEEIQEF
jgi:hypothetical protein